MAHLEQRLVVEAEISQRLPVGLDHPARRGAQLLRHGAELALARGEEVQVSPAVLLDGLNELRSSALDTQKLCVRLEHALELVLGARQLTAKPRDVGPAGQPQVAHHEVGGVHADAGHANEVLSQPRQQLAERLALDELHGGVRGLPLSLAEELRQPLVGGRGGPPLPW